MQKVWTHDNLIIHSEGHGTGVLVASFGSYFDDMIVISKYVSRNNLM